MRGACEWKFRAAAHRRKDNSFPALQPQAKHSTNFSFARVPSSSYDTFASPGHGAGPSQIQFCEDVGPLTPCCIALILSDWCASATKAPAIMGTNRAATSNLPIREFFI